MIKSSLTEMLRASMWYGVAILASRVAPIILLPFYVRWFSQEGMGAIQGITALSSLLYIMMALAFSDVAMRYYYEYKSSRELESFLGTLLAVLIIGIGFVWAIALLSSSYLSEYLFGNVNYQSTILIALSGALVWIINDFFFALVRLEKDTKRYLIISLSQLVANVFFNYLFIVVFPFGINGVFFALLLSQIIAMGMLIHNRYILVRPRFSWTILRRVLPYAQPLVISGILEWFRGYYYQIYSLKHFGEAELGSISIGIRIVQIFILIDAGLQRAWYPIAMSALSQPRWKELYRYYYRYSFMIYVIAFIVLSLFSKEGISLFATDEYKQAFRCVPILFLLPLSLSLSAHYAHGLWISEKTKYIAIATGCGAVVGMGLIHFLAVPFQQYGALFGAAIGSFVMAFTSFYFAERIYPIGYSLKPIWYFVPLAVIVIFYNLKIASSEITPLELAGKMVFALSALIAIYRIWLDKKERMEIKAVMNKYLLRFGVVYSSDS